MEDNLEKLLKKERECRNDNNFYECFSTCLKIINEIQLEKEDIKYDIISKIFLYENQSNYVKISLMNSILKNPSIINNKSQKKKYYQLLIDSLSKGGDNNYKREINQIKKLYEKSEINNYNNIDKYITSILTDVLNK